MKIDFWNNRTEEQKHMEEVGKALLLLCNTYPDFMIRMEGKTGEIWLDEKRTMSFSTPDVMAYELLAMAQQLAQAGDEGTI